MLHNKNPEIAWEMGRDEGGLGEKGKGGNGKTDGKVHITR